MPTLQEALTRLLYEIAQSPTVPPDVSLHIQAWLSEGDNWDLLKPLSTLLHAAAGGGIPPEQFFSRLGSLLSTEQPPPITPQFFREVPLPPRLTHQHLYQSMTQTQNIIAGLSAYLRAHSGAPLPRLIQANNLGGIISNILTHALGSISPYQHNHHQRYPDLKDPLTNIGLELKASNKPGKGGESHNGHGGWHLIACYQTNAHTGHTLFTHIEIAQLIGYHAEREGDWHYCGSTVDVETGSQRTETYYTTLRGTSKLRDGSVYLDTDHVQQWQKWRHAKSYPIPPYSPLYFQQIDNKTKVPSPHPPHRIISWQTAKQLLFKQDPNWPLYDRPTLQVMGLPTALIDLLRPPKA